MAGGTFSFEGECFSFRELQVSPHAVDIPLVLGGNTPAAMRRAATVGDGWITSGTPTLETAVDLHGAMLDQVDSAIAAGERDAGRRAFRAHVRMAGLDPADLDRYRKAGIEDVVVWAHQIHQGTDPTDREARHRAVRRWRRARG